MAVRYKQKALNLSEPDIRFAMSHTLSNRQAAAFLGCSYSTYIKYASMYRDSESGMTLLEIHNNKGLKNGRKKAKGKWVERVPLLEILEGKHPKFPAKLLKKRILREGAMLEECFHCGFNERRITDGSVPLILVWKDGDFTNHKFDNLELTCYNHYFLMYDDVFQKAETISIKCKGYYDQ